MCPNKQRWCGFPINNVHFSRVKTFVQPCCLNTFTPMKYFLKSHARWKLASSEFHEDRVKKGKKTITLKVRHFRLKGNYSKII